MSLEKEFKFFESVRRRLLKDHKHEWVVIKGNDILGYYPSMLEGIKSTQTSHALGSFMVHEIKPKDEDIEWIGSRVETQE